MFMIPYEVLFREQAMRETRSLSLKGYPGIPDGDYAFLDSYCPDPRCECQRVMFRVLSRRLERQVATFSCGFTTQGKKSVPELEPLGPQSPYASAIMEVVAKHLEEDPAYVERLKTHYLQVKSVADDPQHPCYNRLMAWQEQVEKEERRRERAERKRQPPKASEPPKVPKEMQPIFEDIAERMDAFCQSHLNDECAAMARRMSAALARKRPSPLNSGKRNVWACAILYALAQTNFLFDKTQTLHATPDELCDWFDVSKSTAGSKAKQVRDRLKIGLFDPKWCLPSLLDVNPLAWLVEIDGMMVDIRELPRSAQELAYRLGLIPYIPGEG